MDSVHVIKTLKLQSVRITDRLEISVINFKEKSYVSFHDCLESGDRVVDCYININKEEFSKLLARVSELSTYLLKNKTMDIDMPDTLLPESELKLRQPRDYCYYCDDMMSAIVVDGKGRSRKTKLGSQEFTNLLKSQVIRCEYCGEEPKLGHCHCHRYDCKTCEKDSFCKRCDGILYYESRFSKM